VQARWATPDDVDELLRLRAVMLDAMGRGGAEERWGPIVEAQLRAGLVDGRFFAAVVDDGAVAGRLAGGGVGMVHERLAGATDDGLIGYVQSMATDPGHRRAGVARAVLALLLDGFVERGVAKVALHATAAGEALYRSAGFGEPSHPELRWVAPDPGH